MEGLSDGLPTLHYEFGDMLDDYSLTELIKEPTRGENTLELVITNNPTKVVQAKVIPGISDHDCPLVEFSISPKRQTQKPRNIPLYKQAKWD